MKQGWGKLLTLILILAMLFSLLPETSAEQNGKPDESTAVSFAPEADGADKRDPSPSGARGAAEQADADKAPQQETTGSEVFDSTEIVLGYNEFKIENAGDAVFFTFIPAEDGYYMFYSLYDDVDTVGYLLDKDRQTIAADDDSGLGNHFCILNTSIMTAGETYYVGARFLDSERTGTVCVFAERVGFGGTAVNDVFEGVNTYSWGGDALVFYPFTASHDGWYMMYSSGVCDTWGVLLDENGCMLDVDDDAGAGRNCLLACGLSEGQQCWLGVRGFRYGDSASCTMLVEPYDGEISYLSVGSNTVSVPERTVWYVPFTAPKTGTYRIRAESGDDTFGYLKTASLEEILSNDDSNSSPDYSFEYDMTAGETYFIGTRFYNAVASGTVRIIIEDNSFDGEIVWNSSDVTFKGSTPYVIANGKAQTPRFTVRNKTDGTTVDPSEYTYSYLENVNAGTGYVVVTMQGAYSGTVTGWFKIYLPATTATAVANMTDGIRITWDPVANAAGYVIYRRAWSSTTNGWTTFERWNNTTALEWTDTNVYAGTRYQYGVKAYFTKRTDPVTGTEIGGNVGDNYNLGMVGPLKTTVRITTRVLKSLKAGSKKITVSWAPSSVFTGYQIKYATDAKFTKNVKAFWVTNRKTSSTEVKSLKNGTEYFFCVRSYHDFEGVRYFGEWSNVLSVKPGSGQTVTGARRALLVGETDYSSAQDLPGSVNDMNAVAGMLGGLSNNFACTKLPNATKTQILNAIKSTFAGAGDGDVSLFYFAGHGASSSSDTFRGALCTVDGQYITFSELAKELSKVKGRVIVIISSCYSGNAIATGERRGGELDPEAFNQSVIDAFAGYSLDGEDVRSGELRKSKFIVLTAAAANEVGWEGVWNNTVNNNYRGHALGTAIIEGMGCKYPNGARSGSKTPADKNGNKQITVRELYDYVYGRVYSWTKDLTYNGKKSPAHVQYYGTDSEVLFRR